MAKVLVIDDDPTMRLVLQRNLKLQGHEVAVAADGAQGWQLAQELHPALVICDWMMPGLNGLEVCQRLRQTPALATTFFILLTSKDQVSDRVHGLDSGADDFLVKPIDTSELQARVRAGLRLYQLNQDLQDQKQRLEAELAEAVGYVRSLLPAPRLTGEITTEWVFVPSTELGGDCFDYFDLDEHRFVFYVIDVAGHGVGAALLSISVLNLLRSGSVADMTQPAAVLALLNRFFPMEQHKDKYFTAWYGIYDRRTRRLTYASAGHPAAVLWQAHQVVSLPGRGLAVGMFPDVTYQAHESVLPAGAQLYLFSDGAYEIPVGEKGELWGREALGQVLSTGADPQTLVSKIPRSPEGWPDDLCLLKIGFA
ncbi:response regulator [Gloeomargarita lithophora Alchichica-D10]|uniref:Response regulator n=1 Tax=Gloeomargarita lithophora Alchichica-D10 TaxID=1188229 RepID=A0A1J0ACS6_9CYAN|nr:SpoIIE family protein phosphatase [Gloeomargarita lithophora]APB33740.1 response regulator [Gloeomargarita lithophora Alchichica-D10]